MCKRKRQYDCCTSTSTHSASSITQDRRADEISACWQTSFTLLTAETSGFVINMKGKNNRVDGDAQPRALWFAVFSVYWL